jgi:4-carboxymuconolactone decarboxylase
MLASRSGIDGQLKFHMMAGLNVGLTREEIEEIIIHTVPYSGFPTAINALNTLKSIE